jgi:SP family general alpha glucoside:H+ symporter-like MFS transporter
VDRFGSKVVMSAALMALIGFTSILVFASSLSMLFIGEVLYGIPWGVFQTLTAPYANELYPMQLRGCLAASVTYSRTTAFSPPSGIVTLVLKIESHWSETTHSSMSRC